MRHSTVPTPNVSRNTVDAPLVSLFASSTISSEAVPSVRVVTASWRPRERRACRLTLSLGLVRRHGPSTVVQREASSVLRRFVRHKSNLEVVGRDKVFRRPRAHGSCSASRRAAIAIRVYFKGDSSMRSTKTILPPVLGSQRTHCCRTEDRPARPARAARLMPRSARLYPSGTGRTDSPCIAMQIVLKVRR